MFFDEFCGRARVQHPLPLYATIMSTAARVSAIDVGKPSEVLIEALRRPVEEEGYGGLALALGPWRVQRTLVAGGL